ncbi:MAG TPA: PadR family transcriptional regulator [Armatimonadota bacterium]|jgi:DNA-binding PadR family transcriptional regulator
MSLEHATLGFLEYQAMSGYDLKALFDKTVRHFWTADQSQIYRTLARITERGWATVEVVPQPDRPDRKVYHITEPGRAELHRWLTEPLLNQNVRAARLVQIFFAGNLTDEEALQMLRAMADDYRGRLEALRVLADTANEHDAPAGSTERDWFFWNLPLENGIRITGALLEWVEGAIERLERGDYHASY